MALSEKSLHPTGEPQGEFPREAAAEQNDRPLNFEQEQKQNINRQLRKLYLKDDLGRLRAFSSMMVLGAGLGLMLARKYSWGITALAGFLLLEAWEGSRQEDSEDEATPELARRAAKAERGDFGQLEVIPFK